MLHTCRDCIVTLHPVTVTKSPQKDKSACLTMQILNKEAVEKVRSEREIPDVQPGCMIQMRLVLSFLRVPASALFGYGSGTDLPVNQ